MIALHSRIAHALFVLSSFLGAADAFDDAEDSSKAGNYVRTLILLYVLLVECVAHAH